MATQKEEVKKDQSMDLAALAAQIEEQEKKEQEILEKAEAVRKAQQARRQELAAAAEPIVAEFRPDIEKIQSALGTMSVAHKEELDEVRARQAEERKSLENEMESILLALEDKGVPRDQVLPKRSGTGKTGKRGPGLKAEALGVVGSADNPIAVTAPRRRVGDGVPEVHNYYCDGTYFYGQMKDGSWSQSTRLSEVSSSHGWHDTKDVAAALLFAAGKPATIMAHPGAVFADGVMVPTGSNTSEDEADTI